MDEKRIEKALCVEVKKREGLCLKLAPFGIVGIPDRLVLLPDGCLGFVEVKRPGERPRPLQVKRLMDLKNLGFEVFVLDNLNDIGGVLDAIQSA